MSVASQELATGLEGDDILTQALLQTGLSTPQDLEEKNSGFHLDENLLSCDVQTLTNNLISKLEDNSMPRILSPSSAINPVAFPPVRTPVKHEESTTCAGSDMQSLGIMNMQSLVDNTMPSSSAGGTFSGGYVNSVNAMPKLRRMENGIVPPHEMGPPPHPPQQGTCAGDIQSLGGFDVELEELLSINVDNVEQPEIEMYPTPTHSDEVHSSYSVPNLVNPQVSLQYNTYQLPINQTASVDLPELMNNDLSDILGSEDNTPDFLDRLFDSSPGHVSYLQNQNSSVTSNNMQANYSTTSYVPTPANPCPHSTSPHLSPTPLTAASRQHQQALNRQRLIMLKQQQQQQRFQSGHKDPSPSDRFPVSRPLAAPGPGGSSSGMASSEVGLTQQVQLHV